MLESVTNEYLESMSFNFGIVRACALVRQPRRLLGARWWVGGAGVMV
jgi:hypothetical protein